MAQATQQATQERLSKNSVGICMGTRQQIILEYKYKCIGFNIKFYCSRTHKPSEISHLLYLMLVFRQNSDIFGNSNHMTQLETKYAAFHTGNRNAVESLKTHQEEYIHRSFYF